MICSRHKDNKQQTYTSACILAIWHNSLTKQKEAEKNTYPNNLNGGGSITFEKGKTNNEQIQTKLFYNNPMCGGGDNEYESY